MKKILCLVTLSMLICGRGCVPPIRAAVEERIVTVAVDIMQPFSEKDELGRIGFDIDLIELIAVDNNWKIQYIDVPTVEDIIDSVENGVVDIGMSGISSKSFREKRIDFSFPYFDSGIQLMVNKKFAKVPLWKRLKKTITPLLRILLIFGIVATFIAHIIWGIERHNGDENSFARAYKKGIGQSYYWTVTVLSSTGFGDIVSKLPTGRAFTCLVMSIGMLGYSTITASMTTIFMGFLSPSLDEITINNFGGSMVGTKVNSTSDKFLETYYSQLKVKRYKNIWDACRDCSNGKIDGAVFDLPTLQYFSRSDPNTVLVGAPLTLEKYSIAMQDDSKIIEDINITILKMIEDGRIEKLKQRWFE